MKLCEEWYLESRRKTCKRNDEVKLCEEWSKKSKKKTYKKVKLQTNNKVNSDNSEKMSTIRTTGPSCSASLLDIVEKLSRNSPVVPKQSSEKPPCEDTRTFKVLEDEEKARDRLVVEVKANAPVTTSPRKVKKVKGSLIDIVGKLSTPEGRDKLAAKLKANAPITTSTREVKKVKGSLIVIVEKLSTREASQRLAAELKTNAPVPTSSTPVNGSNSTVASDSGPSSSVSCVDAAISMKKFECNPVVYFADPANDTNIKTESSDSENEVVTDPLENDISEMKSNVEIHQEDDSPMKIHENETELSRAEMEDVKLHVPAIDISDTKNEAIVGLDDLQLINEIKQMRSDLKRMDQKVQTLTKNVDELNSKLQASENENKLAKTEIKDLKRKICKLEDRVCLPVKKRHRSK